MVCKDALCTWFKELSPHKRIDFMCGMLNMCLPMELRFMGSYVEDLAKKDFHQLRESESKANSRQELSNLNGTDSKTFRTKMAVYLALLHSSNRTCSNILYQLLENNIKEALTVIEDMDEMTIHNILLVLSMAMNHPAFSYHQKSRMYEYYKAASEASERFLHTMHKPESDTFPACFSCETRLYDQGLSPAYSPRPPVHLSNNPVINDKVYVCNIEVKEHRFKESEKKTIEYKLQVTWSNREVTEVYKTYKELEDFHSQLIQRFPDEPRFSENSLNLPVKQGSLNHAKEVIPLLSKFVRFLCTLPPHLKHSELMMEFLTGIKAPLDPPKQMMDASTSPRPHFSPDLPPHSTANSGDEEPVIFSYNKPQSVYNSYLHQSLASDMCILSPHNQVHSDLTLRNTAAHSPSCSTKTTSPLLLRSPCHSSVSSMESPPPRNQTSPPRHMTPPPRHMTPPLSHVTPPSSNPTSPNLQDREERLLGMNSHLLCNDSMGHLPTEQLNSMRLEDSEAGLKENSCNVMSVMDSKIREKPVPAPVPNGLLDTPMAWHPQLHPGPYLPFQPMQAPFHFPPPYQVCGHHIQGQEISPGNSLNSSPSPSPHSSSDDSDKDKHSSQSTLNGRSKGNSSNYSGRSSHQAKTGEDQASYQTGNENGNSVQGHSGYTSDPTYQRPPQMRVYKAQPAHTGYYPRMVTQMPDSFKTGASIVPFAIPQHFQMPASGHGYMADANQRLLCLPYGPGIVNRHYQMNPVNNARQMYGNGMMQTSNPQLNHSLSSSTIAAQSSQNTNGSSGKLYQGSSVIHTAQSSPNTPLAGMIKGSVGNVMMNGSESGAQSQTNIDLCPHRTGTSNSIPGTSTVTYTTACQSQPSNHTMCSHCGCSGSVTPTSSQQQPLLAYQNVSLASQWHQYSNGMIQLPHPVIVHPNQYPNGFNQELLYNAQYGQMNPVSQGVGVPNFYGYNFSNSAPHNPSGGYPKKPKKLNCHNCGSSKHMAGECNEVSMEAMSGHNMYSYKPKSDSE